MFAVRKCAKRYKFSCMQRVVTPCVFVCMIGRFGMPEDCAGAVAFLSSNDASYLTGETIVVAGGMQSHL